ncbi:MAG: methyltransferase domain-containing protein [Chitinophagaceae bacterium]|nr:methyltransferase domain-containing protein [Chitinophagaceae bacterium]
MEDNRLIFEEGVWVSEQARQRFGAFEDTYLEARRKEQRVLSIEEIRKLPDVPGDYIHAREWALRRSSIHRLMEHIGTSLPAGARILDVGCGNGFLAKLLSRFGPVAGADVNLFELKQASRAFGDHPQLQWYYTDITDRSVFAEGQFDLITFCSSFQYFPDVQQVVDTCLYYLAPGGRILITDTPFYPKEALGEAKNRSRAYYKTLGVDALAQHYFHHSLDAFSPYRHRVIRSKRGLLDRIFSKDKSPFPLVELTKPEGK